MWRVRVMLSVLVHVFASRCVSVRVCAVQHGSESGEAAGTAGAAVISRWQDGRASVVPLMHI